jgi:hypothetical protein
MPHLRPRLSVWKEIFWKPWLVVVAAIYSSGQVWQFIRGELRPDIQESLRIFNLIPKLSWQTWAIGWLLLFLIVTLEGAYRAIARRDRLTEGVGGKLTELRETAIVGLFNRPVRTDQELKTLQSDIEKWTNETLSVLLKCATPSEVSSFRVLGSLPASQFFGVFNAEHNHEKLMLNIRLIRRYLPKDRSRGGLHSPWSVKSTFLLSVLRLLHLEPGERARIAQPATRCLSRARSWSVWSVSVREHG